MKRFAKMKSGTTFYSGIIIKDQFREIDNSTPYGEHRS
jgi:hypothetical protein